MTLKLGLKHQWIQLYKVCINHDPGMALTYFMGWLWPILWQGQLRLHIPVLRWAFTEPLVLLFKFCTNKLTQHWGEFHTTLILRIVRLVLLKADTSFNLKHTKLIQWITLMIEMFHFTSSSIFSRNCIVNFWSLTLFVQYILEYVTLGKRKIFLRFPFPSAPV